MEQISKIVGAEKMKLYESKNGLGCSYACLSILVGVVLFFISWLYFVASILIALAIFFIIENKHDQDPVYSEVAKAIEEWQNKHPHWIINFEKIDSVQKSDGWFKETEIEE